MTKREKILKVARDNPRLSRNDIALRVKCDPSYVYMVLGPKEKIGGAPMYGVPQSELESNPIYRATQSKPEPVPEDNTIKQVLAERGKDYGDYASKAQFIQNVKLLMRMSPSWFDMDADMRESMEMIAHKMGRVVYGNPAHKDNFLDIAGYAKLVADRL
jgi:hypothetical protein